MTQRKVQEVKDKHISFRITETEYNALKSIMKHLATVDDVEVKEAVMKRGINNYIRLIVMKHIEPYIFSRTLEPTNDENISKLQKALRASMKFNQAVFNQAIDDLEKKKKDKKFNDNVKKSGKAR